MSDQSFTPALGIAALTPLYDSAIRLLTRENIWRNALITYATPVRTDRILDVGCGTGSLAIRLKQQYPQTEIHGIDPDFQVLKIARNKALKSNLSIDFHQGFLTLDSINQLGHFSIILSSLVFHQTPIEEKRNILNSMARLLQPKGQLFIADYGLQRTRLMKTLFRSTIQMIDGTQDTQPNAEGCLPNLMTEAGFINVMEREIILTATGSISIYSAQLAD